MLTWSGRIGIWGFCSHAYNAAVVLLTIVNYLQAETHCSFRPAENKSWRSWSYHKCFFCLVGRRKNRTGLTRNLLERNASARKSPCSKANWERESHSPWSENTQGKATNRKQQFVGVGGTANIRAPPTENCWRGRRMCLSPLPKSMQMGWEHQQVTTSPSIGCQLLWRGADSSFYLFGISSPDFIHKKPWTGF